MDMIELTLYMVKFRGNDPKIDYKWINLIENIEYKLPIDQIKCLFLAL